MQRWKRTRPRGWELENNRNRTWNTRTQLAKSGLVAVRRAQALLAAGLGEGSAEMKDINITRAGILIGTAMGGMETFATAITTLHQQALPRPIPAAPPFPAAPRLSCRPAPSPPPCPFSRRPAPFPPPRPVPAASPLHGPAPFPAALLLSCRPTHFLPPRPFAAALPLSRRPAPFPPPSRAARVQLPPRGIAAAGSAAGGFAYTTPAGRCGRRRLGVI